MDTFMVRVWTPGEGDWSPGVRGTATHLASGKQVTFTEAEGLIAFLAEANTTGEKTAGDDTRSTTITSHVRL
jgi:hypothetical protein